MSYAVKIAKAQYRGDPGLFSFIGKGLGALAGVVSRVVPGPIGAVAGLAQRVLAGNGKPVNPSVLRAANTAGMFPSIPVLQPQSPGSQIGLVNIQRPQLPMAPPGGNQTQGGFGGQTSTGAACQSGYHRNKSGYYSQRYGWVAAGSVCVKNRKRNPLNPRAASRAMSRLTSARKATRSIQKFFGKTSRPGAAVATKGPCGCKGRR